jgi:hypothetical protein
MRKGVKIQKRLAARRHAWHMLKDQKGKKCPGSFKKS